ncbi:MAG: sarcosine oxidase subunit gamma [Gammaproteobacteria bacterium]|nr:sarcosine oxidase subunit gamma [Gammaproteobacteria bacterium]
MPDKQDLPVRISPLLPGNGDYIVDYKNVRLSERGALTAIQVLTFNGKHPDAAAAIAAALGIKCSTRPGIVNSDGKTQVCWNGPNSWMVVCSDAEAGHAPGELFKLLQDAVGDLGAVVDQSHGRCGLRLSGSRARQVMAKNTAIDLHPRAFGPGQCAMTSVAHMNATVIQVDDTPTYDLFVIRSLARSFAHAIEHACHEFESEQ